MKTILLLIGISAFLTSTGCIVADGGGWHRHERHEEAVIVGPPVVEVRPAVIVVPDIRVRVH